MYPHMPTKLLKTSIHATIFTTGQARDLQHAACCPSCRTACWRPGQAPSPTRQAMAAATAAWRGRGAEAHSGRQARPPARRRPRPPAAPSSPARAGPCPRMPPPRPHLRATRQPLSPLQADGAPLSAGSSPGALTHAYASWPAGLQRRQAGPTPPSMSSSGAAP